MAYRVAGRPHLETTRPQGGPDDLWAGKIDVRDLKPGVLSGLERVARQLGVRFIDIFSGYRTDAYSEHVGGFAGDPHTRRIAVDANVGATPIGNVPRAKRLLEDAGFISGATPNFYHGQPDPSHVQLRNEAGSGGPDQPAGQQNITLSELWINAGGKPALANIMAAIALAESGGRVNAIGGPNDDGTYDYGLWQINSSHHYSRRRLLHSPAYNAHAAVDIERTQGLDAWTTYRSGAYRSHLGEPGPKVPAGGGYPGPARRRPGGQNANGDGGAAANQEAAFRDYIDPLAPYGTWDALETIFGSAGKALGSGNPLSQIAAFFHWIAWLFSPRNILRIVEFLAGAGLVFFGLGSALKIFDSPSSSSEGPKRYGRVRRKVASSGRVGRAAATGGPGAAVAETARSARKARRARAERRLAESEGVPF